MTLNEFLTEIANAIRSKKGTSGTIKATSFASEIASLNTGSGKPTLFAPSIAFDEDTAVLTVSDNASNGGFTVTYDLYADGAKVTTLSRKTVTLADYINHTKTINVWVQANSTNFNPSESNTIEWEFTDGELEYSLWSDGTYGVSGMTGTFSNGEVIIPDTYNGKNVTFIYGAAFEDNEDIKSVVGGDNVALIGERAFAGSSLESITMGFVREIGLEAFDMCSNLTSVNLGGSLIFIREGAFMSCAFERILLPATVSTIEDYAFSGCSNLEFFVLEAETEYEIPTLGVDVFENCPVNILVHPDLVSTLKAKTNWSNYANKIFGTDEF